MAKEKKLEPPYLKLGGALNSNLEWRVGLFANVVNYGQNKRRNCHIGNSSLKSQVTQLMGNGLQGLKLVANPVFWTPG